MALQLGAPFLLVSFYFAVSGNQTEGLVHARPATHSGLLDGFTSRRDLQIHTAESVYENGGGVEGSEA